jgi:hypothetical protein
MTREQRAARPSPPRQLVRLLRRIYRVQLVNKAQELGTLK